MSTSTEHPAAVEHEPPAPEEPEHEVEELDEETRARQQAALRHVRKLGDPVLRASAVAVERFDESLRAEVRQMGELMQDALGVGLAATQIGVLHRVLVYKAYRDDPLTALVNPVLEWESEERETAQEGCLSLPGVHVEVDRAARVRVRARDPHGKELTVEAEGLRARVIQHELDHLEGVLILDRISREARREAMRALRQAREEERDGEGEGEPPVSASGTGESASGPEGGASGPGEAASGTEEDASGASEDVADAAPA